MPPCREGARMHSKAQQEGAAAAPCCASTAAKPAALALVAPLTINSLRNQPSSTLPGLSEARLLLLVSSRAPETMLQRVALHTSASAGERSGRSGSTGVFLGADAWRSAPSRRRLGRQSCRLYLLGNY